METPEINPQLVRVKHAAVRGRVPLNRPPMPMDEVVAFIPKDMTNMSHFRGYGRPTHAFVTRYTSNDQYELAILDEQGNVVELSAHYPADVLMTCLTNDINREVNFGRLKTFLRNQ